MLTTHSASIRVLLVEDNPVDREFAQRTLLKNHSGDFEIWCVEGLPEAIQRIRGAKYDVMLLDLGLPGCSGLEALLDVREENQKIPVIVLTGLNDEQVALEAIEKGAQDYLVKGQLTADSLRKSIHYAIQRQQLLAVAKEHELAVRQAEARKSAMLESALDAIITIDCEGQIVEFNPAAEKTFGYSREHVLGKLIQELLIPARHREKHQQGLAHYLVTGETAMLNRRLELSALHFDGNEFPIELTITRIPVAGSPMFTAFIRDISETKQANAALDERVRLANLTASIGVILTRREDLRSTLQECVESLVEHLNVAFARIWTFNPQENVLELQASAGIYTHIDGPHQRVPLGQFKIGLIAAERRPLFTNNVVGDSRVADQEWARREGMVAFAGYPLVSQDRLVGVVAMFARRELSDATMKAIEAVSDGIAMGIDRCRVAEELRTSEERFECAVRGSTDGIWDWNIETNDVYMSPRVKEMLGYADHEIENSFSAFESMLHPGDRDDVMRLIQDHLVNHTPYRTEFRGRAKSGEDRWCYARGQALWNAAGKAYRMAGSVTDITERKKAEDEQRQTELRFRSIFKQLQLQIERMPIAYLLFDGDFRVIDWNPAAAKIFGYSKEEVLGMAAPFEKIVPKAFEPQAKELLRRIRSGDMSAHSVNENLTKDGRTITCEWINTPLSSEDGTFSGLMCLAQDVTERKRSEEQVRHSQQMEAVGSLAGGIAHEFNNLLQAISGYTQFAITGLSTEDQRCQDLQLVLKAADRATCLTRQLLSFGRRQVLNRTNMDPNHVVAELVKMLRPLIGENIEVQTNLAPSIASIDADSGQIQQVLLNLCINARDAMPEGGRLIIRTEQVSLNGGFFEGYPSVKPGVYVVLSVADTGCGMPAEVKRRIFEPFYTTKELGKGTGLGLAMVYGMVEQHEGIIHVYSEPGDGTTFKIYLPARNACKDSSSPAAIAELTRGSETILIAEDDPLVRGFNVRVLQGAGYKTLVAADGIEALSIFTEQPEAISLALLDVVMPRMGGRALCQRIREVRPEINVVFCTGHDPEMDQAEDILKQGLPLLQKPVDPALLLRTIRMSLDAPKKDAHGGEHVVQSTGFLGQVAPGIGSPLLAISDSLAKPLM